MPGLHPTKAFYSSRLNEETNLVVYDRAIAKLSVDQSFSLIRAPGFASVLNALNVALI